MYILKGSTGKLILANKPNVKETIAWMRAPATTPPIRLTDYIPRAGVGPALMKMEDEFQKSINQELEDEVAAQAIARAQVEAAIAAAAPPPIRDIPVPSESDMAATEMAVDPSETKGGVKTRKRSFKERVGMFRKKYVSATSGWHSFVFGRCGSAAPSCFNAKQTRLGCLLVGLSSQSQQCPRKDRRGHRNRSSRALLLASSGVKLICSDRLSRGVILRFLLCLALRGYRLISTESILNWSQRWPLDRPIDRSGYPDLALLLTFFETLITDPACLLW